MACKLTKSLNGKGCEYALAGARASYLANYYPPVVGAASVAGKIAYTFDTDGFISSIKLPTDEKFYEIKGEENTLSYVDALLAGANGNMYRQQTFNAIVGQLDIDYLNEADALSLGKFIVIVIDKQGRIVVLGRQNGLKAPAGGNDYNSGAAEADAQGTTIILQGTSGETQKLVLNEAVIDPIYEAEVIDP